MDRVRSDDGCRTRRDVSGLVGGQNNGIKEHGTDRPARPGLMAQGVRSLDRKPKNRADETLEAIFNSPAWVAAIKSAAATFDKLATKPRPLSGSGRSPHAYASTAFGDMGRKL